MKMFGNLGAEGAERDGDRLVGGGFVVDTGVYDTTVKLMYTRKSKNGADGVTVHMDCNGKEVRETFYVTNAKGENFYIDKKTQARKLLPSYTMVDDLCLVTLGIPLAELEWEEKVVKLYDPNAKAETNQTVPVATGILGKPVTAAVVRQIVDKRAQNSQGAYEATGDTREENVFEKFFNTESKRTVTEALNGIEEANFYEKWVEANEGKPARNRAKGGEGRAGAPGRPAAQGGAPAAGQAPKRNLFA